jgi:outer membrane immunogenic protein
MIKLIASASVLALMASAANAQFAGGLSGPPSPWYGGLSLGYVTGTADLKWNTGPGDVEAFDELDYDGWDGGIYAGYRWMYNQIWYLGGEIGYNYTDADGSQSNSWFSGSGLSNSVEKSNEYYISLKGGALVQPNVLLYSIAGYQYADFDYDLEDSTGATLVSQSEGVDGLHLGVGVEYFLSDQFSVRGEYKFQAYDDIGGSFDGGAQDAKAEPRESVFRLGASWNF